MIRLLNLLLFFIRLLTLRRLSFKDCFVNGKRIDMWELKPKDRYTIEGDETIYVALNWPQICWWEGRWGVWSIPEEVYEEWKHDDYPQV